MTLLYQILRNFLVYFLPLVILVFSVSLNLPDANLHKQTFQKTDFYNKLSQELIKINSKNSPGENTGDNFTASFWVKYAKDFENPEILKDTVEKNLDLSGAWLLQKTDNWNFYLPYNSAKNNASKEIQTTKDLIENQKENLPTCNNETLENLKNQAANGQISNLQANFCLPGDVKSGQKTLESFLQENQLQDSLSSFVIQSTDGLKTNSVNLAGQNIYNFFNFLRQYLTRIRSTAPMVIIGMLTVLLVITLLAGTIGRNPWLDLRNNLWKLAISTLSLSAILLLILGGLAFVNSWFGEFLFGQKSSEISNILTVQWLWFLFDVASLAIWSSVTVVILSLILSILPKNQTNNQNSTQTDSSQKLGNFNNLEPKESNNQPNKFKDENSKNNLNNQTFDQQFQHQARPIYQPKPIKPNLNGVVLPHEQYEIPSQIPARQFQRTASKPNLFEINSNDYEISNSNSTNSSTLTDNPYAADSNYQINSEEANSTLKSPNSLESSSNSNSANFIMIDENDELSNQNSFLNSQNEQLETIIAKIPTNIFVKIKDEIWFQDWLAIQNMSDSEYKTYFEKNETTEHNFRFLQIDEYDNFKLRFQWEHRVMTLGQNNQIDFLISPASNPYTFGKAILLDKENFVQNCLQIGLSQENLHHFFTKLEMTKEDWENF